MNGEQRTEGERRAAEEFADAVRDQAARFFDAMMEEMRRNPRAYGLGSQPLSGTRGSPRAARRPKARRARTRSGGHRGVGADSR